MFAFGDVENVAGSRCGSHQNTRASATESTIALMARHFIVVIPCSPSRASAEYPYGQHPYSGCETRAALLRSESGDWRRTNCHRTAAWPIGCYASRLGGSILHAGTKS